MFEKLHGITENQQCLLPSGEVRRSLSSQPPGGFAVSESETGINPWSEIVKIMILYSLLPSYFMPKYFVMKVLVFFGIKGNMSYFKHNEVFYIYEYSTLVDYSSRVKDEK